MNIKAFRIHGFGSPSIGVLEAATLAEPAPGDVVVRIEAASVNPLDLKMMAGYMQSVFPMTLPYSPGTDIAGVVQRVGSAVTALRVGERVLGRLQPTAGGGFAEAAVISAGALTPVPAHMSFEQAAALPTAAATAQLALFGVGGLQAGQRVLVHAAAGGVGCFAVQLAKQAGAHVIATASAGNRALVTELGAGEVIDYRTEDFTRLRDIDLVIDAVGGDVTERSWQVLRPGGMLASLVDFAVQPRDGKRGAFVFFDGGVAAMPDILAAFEENRLQIVLDAVHPLEETRAALEQVAAGHARGKVIIRASH